MGSAQFTLKMCIAAQSREKFTKTPGGSRSFKVIDVGTTGKLVSSACYYKQQVCVYLQPFSRLEYQIVVKLRFLRGCTHL